jgi:hypothetical protein
MQLDESRRPARDERAREIESLGRRGRRGQIEARPDLLDERLERHRAGPRLGQRDERGLHPRMGRGERRAHRHPELLNGCRPEVGVRTDQVAGGAEASSLDDGV